MMYAVHQIECCTVLYTQWSCGSLYCYYARRVPFCLGKSGLQGCGRQPADMCALSYSRLRPGGRDDMRAGQGRGGGGGVLLSGSVCLSLTSHSKKGRLGRRSPDHGGTHTRRGQKKGGKDEDSSCDVCGWPYKRATTARKKGRRRGHCSKDIKCEAEVWPSTEIEQHREGCSGHPEGCSGHPET